MVEASPDLCAPAGARPAAAAADGGDGDGGGMLAPKKLAAEARPKSGRRPRTINGFYYSSYGNVLRSKKTDATHSGICQCTRRQRPPLAAAAAAAARGKMETHDAEMGLVSGEGNGSPGR